MITDKSLIQVGFEAIAEEKRNRDFADWITSPEALEYFGSTFALKADTLAALINHSSLLAVAKKHGVSDEAVYLHARKAKRVFQVLVD